VTPIRIVVVREQLEDREIANWVPLNAHHNVSLLTRPTAGPYAATGLGLPVAYAKNQLDRVPSVVLRRVAGRLARRVDVERLSDLSSMESADCIVVNETHLASAAQVCELRARRQNLRVISVCYENIPFRYEDDARLARRKDICRQYVDTFVALTPEARAALIVEGVSPERIIIQPYGVDVDRFSISKRSQQIRQRWSTQPGEVVVLFTGRLIQEKGVVELVRAVADVHTDCPVRLVVVGSGTEGVRIDRAARSLGVTSIVRQPWVNAAEIPAIVASADVFALPSLPTPYWEEQLGFSAIEAMASSIPVLGVASGSIPFVVGDGGRFAQPYDHRSLTETLQALTSDAALRASVGAAGRARVEQTLNTASCAAELQTIVERVVGT
jgi:glycosyltransferase involved in cell wall biosynthesis